MNMPVANGDSVGPIKRIQQSATTPLTARAGKQVSGQPDFAVLLAGLPTSKRINDDPVQVSAETFAVSAEKTIATPVSGELTSAEEHGASAIDLPLSLPKKTIPRSEPMLSPDDSLSHSQPDADELHPLGGLPTSKRVNDDPVQVSAETFTVSAERTIAAPIFGELTSAEEYGALAIDLPLSLPKKTIPRLEPMLSPDNSPSQSQPNAYELHLLGGQADDRLEIEPAQHPDDWASLPTSQQPTAVSSEASVHLRNAGNPPPNELPGVSGAHVSDRKTQNTVGTVPQFISGIVPSNGVTADQSPPFVEPKLVDQSVTLARSGGDATLIPLAQQIASFLGESPLIQTSRNNAIAGPSQQAEAILPLRDGKPGAPNPMSDAPPPIQKEVGKTPLQFISDDSRPANFAVAGPTPLQRSESSLSILPQSPEATPPVPPSVAGVQTPRLVIAGSAAQKTDIAEQTNASTSLLIATETPEVFDWAANRTSLAPQGTVALHRADMAAQVGRQLVEVAPSAGNRPIDIALSPEELGRVRMGITMEDGKITVSILAERPETLDLMRKHIDQLGQSFRSLGYEQVSFSFGQGAQSGNQAGADPHEQTTPPPAGTVQADAETGPAIIHLDTATTNGVDIRL